MENPYQKLKKIKINLSYRDFLLYGILIFGFTGTFIPVMITHDYNLTIGQIFIGLMFILFLVMFILYEEKKHT